MSDKFKNGSVKISNDIFDVIAKEAADEIRGVYSIDNTEQKATKKEDSQVITQFEGEELIINLQIVLDPNVNIISTVEKIQENVQNKIEMMTGIHVKEVNIKVLKLVMNYE